MGGQQSAELLQFKDHCQVQIDKYYDLMKRKKPVTIAELRECNNQLAECWDNLIENLDPLESKAFHEAQTSFIKDHGEEPDLKHLPPMETFSAYLEGQANHHPDLNKSEQWQTLVDLDIILTKLRLQIEKTSDSNTRSACFKVLDDWKSVRFTVKYQSESKLQKIQTELENCYEYELDIINKNERKKKVLKEAEVKAKETKKSLYQSLPPADRMEFLLFSSINDALTQINEALKQKRSAVKTERRNYKLRSRKR